MLDNLDRLDELNKEELEKLLIEVESEQSKYFNYEQSVKRILNSIYGAFGNQWFYFFNINIAESITLQGQHAILHTEKIINKYFHEFWHKDKEVHEKLGITVTGQIHKPMVIYIDTDSAYVTFEEVLDKCDWHKSEKEFILALNEARLATFIEKALRKYADSYGCTDNFLNFEMESIARNGVWLAKKKYLQNIVWSDPDVHFDDLTKIKVKGWNSIQSSTPTASRKILNDALTIVFKEDDLNVDHIATFLREQKKQFKLHNVEDICENLRMNNYEKYVTDDTNELEYAKGAGPNVRGSGFYNFLLNKSGLKTKYELIKSGEKTKMYYTTDPKNDTFSFVSGKHPYEFAPEIDYETQFEKTVIDPLNKVLASMGLQQLDRSLIYAGALF